MTMTATQLRHLRVDKLGISAAKFARLTGLGDGRTVRRYEADDYTVPPGLEAFCDLLMALNADARAEYVESRLADPGKRAAFLARKLEV